jgi:hypothetical protein
VIRLMTLVANARRVLAAIMGVLVWAVVGAALLAPAGALFGVLFGAVAAWLHDQPSAFVPALVRCTLAAAAAGAILGGFIRLVDGYNPLVSATHKPITGVRRPPRARRPVPAPILNRIGGRGLNSRWPRWEGGQHDPSMN